MHNLLCNEKVNEKMVYMILHETLISSFYVTSVLGGICILVVKKLHLTWKPFSMHITLYEGVYRGHNCPFPLF